MAKTVLNFPFIIEKITCSFLTSINYEILYLGSWKVLLCVWRSLSRNKIFRFKYRNINKYSGMKRNCEKWDLKHWNVSYRSVRAHGSLIWPLKVSQDSQNSALLTQWKPDEQREHRRDGALLHWEIAELSMWIVLWSVVNTVQWN